jgi:hypothetical protein
VFEQLGMLDELKKISLPIYEQQLYDANMQKVASMTMKNYKEV